MLARDNIYVLKSQLSSYFGDLKRRTINDGSHTWSYIDSEVSDKPVVLFLHATMGYKALWRGLMTKLASDYRVIAVDIPGLYLGLKHRDDVYHFDAQVAYLENFLNALKISNVSIVGHSMGANIAAFFAIKNPLRVENLVLASPSGLDLLLDKSDFDRFVEYKQSLFFSNYDEFYRNQTMLFHQTPNVPKILLERRMEEVQFNRSFIVRVMEEMQNSVLEVIERLGEITCPTLAIHGANDFLIKPDTFEILKERLPLMSQVVLKECGHIPFLEYPKKTEDIVRQFFQEPANNTSS